MDKDSRQVDFDLSLLKLDELIKLHNEISQFKVFLSDKLIEDKESDDNE